MKTIDILMRSVMGLTGAHTRSGSSRPRGVLFFAGPTGVGKTEMAKTLTEILFGDERAYIRFDMSEFAEEHASARLCFWKHETLTVFSRIIRYLFDSDPRLQFFACPGGETGRHKGLKIPRT